ncbi:MAG: cysteine hydrolase [Erysipelothrix sp.]|nr:cysteine hydrolase [Erysipelothrix sp.]
MKLLLVVDVINGFLKEGNMSFDGDNVIAPIEALIKEFIKNDDMIITFRDQHEKDSLEFITYPEHCVIGTSEVDLIDELSLYKPHIIDIPKNSTNGTNTIAFQNILSDNVFEEVVVVGVCTDICVLQAVLSLITYFYENDIDTKVTVVKDAVDTFDTDQHKQDYYNELSFNLMANASANLVESHQDLIKG